MDEALTSSIALIDGRANAPEWETGGALQHAPLVLLWWTGTDRLAGGLGGHVGERSYSLKRARVA